MRVIAVRAAAGGSGGLGDRGSLTGTAASGMCFRVVTVLVFRVGHCHAPVLQVIP
ncbi:hypothetical protein BF49_0143 [Bradyrhizobium sp.]|nr:hypothetical protein BF49_0143 [Bradyrhizobium sp.]